MEGSMRRAEPERLGDILKGQTGNSPTSPCDTEPEVDGQDRPEILIRAPREVPEYKSELTGSIAAKAAELKRLVALNQPLAAERRILAGRSKRRTAIASAFTMRNIPTDEGVRSIVMAEDPPES